MPHRVSYGDKLAAIGTIAAQPTSGTVKITNVAVNYPFFSMTFELTAAAVPITDGAGSGSHGSLQLFDFVPGSVHIQASRQNYSALSESAGVSGGDTVYDIGLGSAAIAAAADGVLSASATYDDIGAKVDATLSGGGISAAVTTHDPANVILDGTATAVNVYINASGTAATVDASGYLYVTGTATVNGSLVGDD